MAATTAQQTALAHLYLALFDRAPDAAGFEFWSQALANGASIESITRSFVTSPEATTIYPATQTAEQFVSGFYQAVFGRAPDAGGLAFWTGVLNAAGGSGSDVARASLVAQIVSVVSTPLATKPADLSDAQYAQTVADRELFAKKTVAGLDFAINVKSNDLTLAKQIIATLETPAAPAPQTPAPILGQTFLLTASVDAFTGGAGDDTFDARYPSGNQRLGNSDRLDGGAGIDTLYATISLSNGQPQFSNIENLVLNSLSAGAILDLRNVTGLTKVEFAGSAANGRVDYVGKAALSVVGQTADVRFLASTATDLSLTLKDVGAAGAASLVVVNNTLNVGDATSITHGIAMTDAHVTLQASGNVPVRTVNVAATGANTLNLVNGWADAVWTLAITGSGSVDLSASTSPGGGKLPGLTRFTAGDGDVTLTTTAATAGSLDIATGDGAARIVANGASIKTLDVGGGNDVVTLNTGALSSTAVVNLGAGNDTLTLAVGSRNGVVIDAGDGDDTIITGVVTHTVTPVAAASEVHTVRILSGASGPTSMTVNGYSIPLGVHSQTIDEVGRTIVAFENDIIGYSNAGGRVPLQSVRFDTATQSVVLTYKLAAGNVPDDTTVLASAGGVTFGAVDVTTQGATAVVVPGSVDTLTGGAGADTFMFTTPDVDTTAGAVTAVITDFRTGVDKIRVTDGAAGAAGSSTTVQKVSLGTYDSLENLLVAADATLTGAVKYFIASFGGSAYVVTDGDGVGYTNVIKLAGVPITGIVNTDLIGSA